MSVKNTAKFRSVVFSNSISGPTIDTINTTLGQKAETTDARFADVHILRVKSSGAGTGEYSSISAACAAITDSSATNPYIIYVGPGVYAEPEITVPTYVSIVGSAIQTTIVKPVGNNNIFVMSEMTEFSFFTIVDVPSGYTGIVVADIYYGQLHKISTDNCYSSIRVTSTTADTYLYMEYVDFNDVYTYGVEVTAQNGFIAYVNAENFYGFPTGTQATSTVHATGDTFDVSVLAGSIEGDSSAGVAGIVTSGAGKLNVESYRITDTETAIRVENGTSANVTGAIAVSCTLGFLVGGSGNPPDLAISGMEFENCTRNVQVNNLLTTGFMQNASSYNKTFINASTPFGIKNKPNNSIVVAKSGGDFTTIADAVAAINITIACNTTSGGTTVTSATAGAFSPVLTGLAVTGTGISASTTATYVDDSTLQLSTAATATGSAVALTFARAGLGVPFNILVGPGTFSESAIALPPFVTVQGANAFVTTVEAASSSQPYIFQLTTGNVLIDMIVDGTAIQSVTDTPLINCVAAPGFAGLNNVVLNHGDVGIAIAGAYGTVDSFTIMPSVAYNIRRYIVVDGTAGNQVNVQIIANNTLSSTAALESFCEAKGAKAYVNASSAQALGTGAAGSHAYLISDGATCVLTAVTLQNWETAIRVDGTGAGPQIVASGVNFVLNTRDIVIENPACTGSYQGAYSTFYKNPASTFFIADKAQNTVVVAKSGGDYTTVYDALDFISPQLNVTLTNASTTMTGAFTPDLDGLAVAGTGIPASTTATYVDSATMTLSAAATTSATVTATFTKATSANVYIVNVAPGTYTETNSLTIPAYVMIIGLNTGACVLQPSNANANFITMNKMTSLQNVIVTGVTGTGYSAVVADSVQYLAGGGTSEHFEPLSTIKEVTFRGNYRDVTCTATTGRSEVHIHGCQFRATIDAAMYIIGTSATTVAEAIIGSFDSYYELSVANAVAIRATGPNATVISTAEIADGNSVTGVAYVEMSDGADVSIIGAHVTETDTAIHVLNSGSAPVLRVTGTNFASNTTYDLNVEHAGTTGGVMSNASRSKVSVVTGSTLSLMYNDMQGNDTTITGDLYLGSDNTTATNVSSLLRDTPAVGVVSGGAITAVGGSLAVSVTAGTGYAATGTAPSTTLVYVTWSAASSFSVAANSTLYIYVDTTGTIKSSTSRPAALSNIYLGRVRTTASDIELVDTTMVTAAHLPNTIDTYMRDVFGALYVSGSVVAANTSRQLTVTAGKYYYGADAFGPAGAAYPLAFSVYNHVSGAWTRTTGVTVVPNTSYDNGTDLVALTASYYVKHTLYTVGQGSNEQYFLVVGQAEYSDINVATTADIAVPPTYFSDGVVQIATLIVQEGNTTDVTVASVRPTPGKTSAASSATPTLHSSLLGLDADDHTQYLLVNGTRAMTGGLDMGSNTITNAASVNAVVVEAHASRHLPNGADALATATPVTVKGNVASNSTGTANSFARSDHTHAVDLTTFEVNQLAATAPLSVAKGGTGATSFTAGAFLTGNGTFAVTSTKTAPAGTVVGTTDTQTLTNKTMTDASNTILAFPRFTNVIVVSKAGNDTTASRGGLPYLTVAAALAASASGDCVYIMPGTYAESGLSIPQGVSVVGQDMTTCILQASTSTSTTMVTLNQQTRLYGVTVALSSSFGSVVLTGVALASQSALVQTCRVNVTSTSTSDATVYGVRAVAIWGTVTAATQNVVQCNVTCTAALAVSGAIRGVYVNVASQINITGAIVNVTGGSGASAVAIESNNASAIVRAEACFLSGTDSDYLVTSGSIPLYRCVTGTDGALYNAGDVVATQTRLHSTATAARTLTLPDATDTLVGRTTTDILTNKTLTAPVISSITNGGTVTIPSGTDTFVTLTAAQTLTNKTLTAPVISSIVNGGTIGIPAGADTFATLTAVQTLTNKTLTLPTITSIDNGGTVVIPAGADTFATLTAAQTLTNKTLTAPVISSIVNGGTVVIPAGADTFVTLTATQTLTNKTLTAPKIATVVNGSATLTLPTTTDTIVGRDTVDTLTNKTLTLPTITSIDNGGTVAIPAGADTFVTLTATQTLTNKTLTTPTIATILNGAATLTLPTATDTIVGRATTDTLTNKTLTLPTIASINNGGTIVIPSGAGTFATLGATQTLTNKTLTAPKISTIVVGTGTLTLPSNVTDTLVARTTTDTLTNKTLTAPVIATIVNSGTLTLPTSTDTLVARNTTDTLTNKTLTAPVIATIVNGGGTLTVPTVTDTIVARTTTDTLTNKTLVGTTNTIRATQLATTGSDVVISSAVPPTAGQALFATSATTAAWSDADATVVFVDQETTGTNGGSATGGVWNKRVLNTVSSTSGGTWYSLDTVNNQFTLSAGTYYFDIKLPASNVRSHRGRLYNVTSATTSLYGMSTSITGNSVENTAHVSGVVTIAGSTTFEVDHYTSTSQNANGFGLAVGIAGVNEVYSIVSICKLK